VTLPEFDTVALVGEVTYTPAKAEDVTANSYTAAQNLPSLIRTSPAWCFLRFEQLS